VAKILIVDDDVTMTGLLRALVEMEGHTPTIVNDSTKAIEIADVVAPDLITLDLMMPKLTGYELCELLHKDARFANTPIIIVSARDDSESKQRALKAGAAYYITKPFDADELMQKIQALTSAPKV
jgi:DNA-binding response OmpR family regulator